MILWWAGNARLGLVALPIVLVEASMAGSATTPIATRNEATWRGPELVGAADRRSAALRP